MRVGILYRVSTQKQSKRDQQEDLPVQVAVNSAYAKANRMIVVKEYYENGVSAFHNGMDERTILREIMADAINGTIEGLIVFKSDRLARRSLDYPAYLYKLHKYGVRVFSASEDRELTIDSQNDKILRFLEGWFAESESVSKSVTVAAHMREKAKSGKYLGGRPAFGFEYNRETKEFKRCESEADILRYAFSRVFDSGLVTIAKELNEAGYRTREGHPWGCGLLGRVMRNPLVCGLRAYDRSKPSKSGKKSRIKTGDPTDFDRFIIPRDEHGNPKPDPSLAIVSFETWLAAMEIMRSRRAKFGKVAGRSVGEGLLLTGFARCQACGRPLLTHYERKTIKGEKRRIPSYRCKSQRESSNSICQGQHFFRASKIDGLFLTELENILSSLDPESLSLHFRRRLERTRTEGAKRAAELEKDLSRSRKLHQEWLNRLDNYLLNPRGSLYSEPTLANKIKEYEERIRETEVNLSTLHRELSVWQLEQEQLSKFAEMVPRWFELFRDAPVRKQKEMLRTIVDTVVIGRNAMIINCNLNILAFMNAAGAQSTEDNSPVISFTTEVSPLPAHK